METTRTPSSAYRGRFAPTPSGPLHLGSLLTALASYLQAKSQGGRWLLRIDDLDQARNVRGADSMIFEQLEAHAMHWDEAPRYQSENLDEYLEALGKLQHDRDSVYACACTRAALKHAALPGPDDAVYPGTCRHKELGERGHALRLRMREQTLCYEDGWLGRQCRMSDTQIGDFVLRRGDGQIAYQLACAIDEKAQGITEVVRGADLLGSTFRQLEIQQRLKMPQANYRHLPVLMATDGRKLSKQNHAAALEACYASSSIVRCLHLLRQAPPRNLADASPAECIAWATMNWQAAAVPRTLSMALE